MGARFPDAEVTDKDKLCALHLRCGKTLAESMKLAYGELDEVTKQKYQKRKARGWYDKIKLNEGPVEKKEVNVVEMVVKEYGGGIYDLRKMTDDEKNVYLWTKDKGVRRLTEIVDDPETGNAVKIQAIKELNAMHGYYAPAQVNVAFNFDGVMAEVERRKNEYLGIVVEGEVLEVKDGS